MNKAEILAAIKEIERAKRANEINDVERHSLLVKLGVYIN